MIQLVRLPFALIVLLYQSAALAASQVRANKVRALLTTLGILIGVAAISAVIALIDGMRHRVLAEFESFGTNKLYIEPKWRTIDRHRGGRQKVVFKASDFDELLEHCPSVAGFSRSVGLGWTNVTYGNHPVAPNVALGGFDPELQTIERHAVAVGRPLTWMDSRQAARVCLINETLRDELELDRDPTGAMIDLGFWGRVMVVGMADPGWRIRGARKQSEAFLPFTYARRRLFYYPLWFEGVAMVKSRASIEDAKSEIEFYMRSKRSLKPGEENNFQIISAQRTIEEVNRIADFMTTIVGGIVAISLLVGGVGIMNIMLVSVSERTREIGLRKAVGARPGTICTQFLVEAVMLCLLGGALGLAAGQGITSVVASYLPDPTRMINYDPIDGDELAPGETMGAASIVLPPQAIALAFTFSASVGLVFGMFPAIKAARLDPIEALRHE